MKKIFIILVASTLLFSCGRGEKTNMIEIETSSVSTGATETQINYESSSTIEENINTENEELDIEYESSKEEIDTSLDNSELEDAIIEREDTRIIEVDPIKRENLDLNQSSNKTKKDDEILKIKEVDLGITQTEIID